MIHPKDEAELEAEQGNPSTAIGTFRGIVHLHWDEAAAVTPFGQ